MSIMTVLFGLNGSLLPMDQNIFVKDIEVAAIYDRKAAMKAAIEAKRKPKEEDKFHC